MSQRTVTITSCVPKQKRDGTVIQGTNNKGPWTMYEVMATSEDGTPIQDDIIAFTRLELGPQVVAIDVRNDPQYGRTYTFTPVDAPPAATATPAANGGDPLHALTSRVEALENAVKALGGFGSSLAQTDVPVSTGPPVQPVNADEDIPF